MKRWLWTFGADTMFAKKYIIVNINKGDGRNILFQIYGRNNLAMSYLLDFEPNKEEELRDRYGYKKIAMWDISDESIAITLMPNANTYLWAGTKENFLTQEDKHQVWDKMIGGI